jgi:hypothetical protein
VWGPAESNFKCTRKNFAGLQENSGILAVIGQVPQTVKDAMELTQGLGERYLWVDALCIIQDDEDDRNRAIGAMDAIYSSAFVTIIAASGTDSNSGLPGVRLGSRSISQDILELSPQLRLILYNEKENHPELMRNTVYEIRAWT